MSHLTGGLARVVTMNRSRFDPGVDRSCRESFHRRGPLSRRVPGGPGPGVTRNDPSAGWAFPFRLDILVSEPPALRTDLHSPEGSAP